MKRKEEKWEKKGFKNNLKVSAISIQMLMIISSSMVTSDNMQWPKGLVYVKDQFIFLKSQSFFKEVPQCSYK